MTLSACVNYLRALLQGIDPDSGNPASREELVRRSEILSAIKFAASELSRLEKGSKETDSPEARRGKAWTSEDEDLLLREFEKGTKIQELSALLKRSPSAIHARLLALGAIDNSLDYSER